MHIVEIDHADDGALARFVAFENELRLSRPRTVERRRAMLEQVAGRMLAVAVDGDTWIGALDATHGFVGTDQLNLQGGIASHVVDPTGVARVLAEAGERWGRSFGATVSLLHVYDATDLRAAPWRSIGFTDQSTRTQWRLALDDSFTPPDTFGGEGARIEFLNDDSARWPAAHDLWVDAMHRVPDPHAAGFIRDYAAWSEELRRHSDGRPVHAVFVAIDTVTDELLGIAILHLDGPPSHCAGHWFTGTASGATGRGVARALKIATIRWAAANGITELRTSNHDTNEAMLHLNAVLGYERVTTTLTLHRALAP